MNSEKVKELKEFIENSAELGQWYKLANCEITIMEVFNYINELEKDNTYKQEHIELWFKKNEEKKKRIAEIAKYNESVRKETAREFLQFAYDRCLEKSFIKKVEELAKQYGVELGE